MATDPALTIDTPDVYLLVRGFSLNIAATNGPIGTRVYLETDIDIKSSTRVPLPNIGDSWSDEYEYVTLKSIEVSYLNDNVYCGTLYTCNYDSNPFIFSAVPLSPEDLPRSLDISEEYDSFDPQKISLVNYWQWKGTNTTTKQKIRYVHPIITYRCTRIVKDFKNYVIYVAGCAGKLNNEEIFGFPVGTVRFKGASLYPFTKKSGAIRWKCELSFVIRSVTRITTGATDLESATNGWNFILNENTGLYDVPVYNSSAIPTYNLFEYTNFQTYLFETDELGEDENKMYNIIPKS